jgi:hypothetical protein
MLNNTEEFYTLTLCPSVPLVRLIVYNNLSLKHPEIFYAFSRIICRRGTCFHLPVFYDPCNSPL